ncbi:hypothetical protein NDA11_003826 [Ustilago hordei]|uniref:Uncharacterized protein n=1 Tax=Ustilago hordei TaxID=120017 RepID=I2FRW0_USTHO|nr:uncharacterized protein UHO2_07299 [Ustilago hordei]KAJ1045044.1 hypothetical protein NDA10_003100 [Ustilago hordei]KAJ1572128.1 hypothetical protein NDA15_005513 [Ustilago hordei]KAJ1573516.1 hypothetical protein NDA11_003826 [Ustilago hordei]KAJ1594456.1 hypothetical protein NDA12_004878 [Ustilago hordei]KAJ1598358.1 hypothetical protein NDA14_006383 [Ustilago hordei]
MVATFSVSTTLRRAPALVAASSSPIRSLHSTRIVRAGTSSSSASAADEEYPSENFGAPIWRYTFLGAIAVFGLYRISTLHADPHPSRASSSGRSAPGNESEDNLHSEGQQKPWLTRYIEHWSTPTSVWKERNARHLELVKEKAEERLLFQDAERPPVHRLRYTQIFEQASPHAVAPGSQVDLSDLKIKKASE